MRPAVFARRAALSIVLYAVALQSSVAQTPPPPPEPGAETAAANAAGAPPRNKWKEDLTAGVQLDDGRAGTKMVSIAGDIWHKYGSGIIRFDAGEQYGSISAGTTRITSLNRQYGSFSWTHDLSKRYYFTQIDSIERDTIRLIDYRASSMNAIGIRVKAEKVAFDFGPGIALIDQQKNDPQIDGFKFDIGGFYSLVYDIDPRWQVTNWATYRNSVTLSADRVIDSSIALTGMITKVIGIKVSATYNYDGVLSPGGIRLGFNTRNYLTTSIGVTLHH